MPNYDEFRSLFSVPPASTGHTHAVSQPGYQCGVCGRTSYNPNDVANRYCGNCHAYANTSREPLIVAPTPAATPAELLRAGFERAWQSPDGTFYGVVRRNPAQPPGELRIPLKQQRPAPPELVRAIDRSIQRAIDSVGYQEERKVASGPEAWLRRSVKEICDLAPSTRAA